MMWCTVTKACRSARVTRVVTAVGRKWPLCGRKVWRSALRARRKKKRLRKRHARQGKERSRKHRRSRERHSKYRSIRRLRAQQRANRRVRSRERGAKKVARKRKRANERSRKAHRRSKRHREERKNKAEGRKLKRRDFKAKRDVKAKIAIAKAAARAATHAAAAMERSGKHIPSAQTQRKASHAALAAYALFSTARKKAAVLSKKERLNKEVAAKGAVTLKIKQGWKGNHAPGPLTRWTTTMKVAHIKYRATNKGWHGFTPKQNIGMEFSTSLIAAKAGIYTFYTKSSDGSNLFVDGQPVVINDGVHSYKEVSGSVMLAAGSHALRVNYFEFKNPLNPNLGLSVQYKGPGRKKGPILLRDTEAPHVVKDEKVLVQIVKPWKWTKVPPKDTKWTRRVHQADMRYQMSPQGWQKLYPKEVFGAMFTTNFKVTKSGTYTFYVSTGGNSFKLYLSDNEIVTHTAGMVAKGKTKKGSVILSKGVYPFRLNFVEAGLKTYSTIAIKVRGPDGKKRHIDESNFLTVSDAVLYTAVTKSNTLRRKERAAKRAVVAIKKLKEVHLKRGMQSKERKSKLVTANMVANSASDAQKKLKSTMVKEKGPKEHLVKLHNKASRVRQAKREKLHKDGVVQRRKRHALERSRKKIRRSVHRSFAKKRKEADAKRRARAKARNHRRAERRANRNKRRAREILRKAKRGSERGRKVHRVKQAGRAKVERQQKERTAKERRVKKRERLAKNRKKERSTKERLRKKRKSLESSRKKSQQRKRKERGTKRRLRKRRAEARERKRRLRKRHAKAREHSAKQREARRRARRESRHKKNKRLRMRKVTVKELEARVTTTVATAEDQTKDQKHKMRAFKRKLTAKKLKARVMATVATAEDQTKLQNHKMRAFKRKIEENPFKRRIRSALAAKAEAIERQDAAIENARKARLKAAALLEEKKARKKAIATPRKAQADTAPKGGGYLGVTLSHSGGVKRVRVGAREMPIAEDAGELF
jgi:hypothetical protein